MSISSIDKIYNEAEVLWDLIKDNKDIPPLDAFFVSAAVISHRNTIENLFKESILPQMSVIGVTAISECRKLLLKIQTKLLKNISLTDLKTYNFFSKVSQIWSRQTKQKDPGQTFGEHYASNLPKDPLVLDALYASFAEIFIENFKKAIECSDLNSAFYLYRKLPQTHQKAIQSALNTDPTAFMPVALAIENACKKKETPEPLLSVVQEGVQKLSSKSIPVINTYVPIAMYHCLKSVQEDSHCRGKFCILLKEAVNIELLTREQVRDFVLLNATHPVVSAILLQIQVNDVLKPIELHLTNKDWIPAKGLLSTLKLPAHSILQSKVAPAHLLQLLNQASPDPILLKGIQETILEMETQIKKLKSKQTTLLKPIGEPFIGYLTVYDPTDPHFDKSRDNLALGYETATYVHRFLKMSGNFYNREEKMIDTTNPTFNHLAFANFMSNIVKFSREYVTENLKKKSLLNNHFVFMCLHEKQLQIYGLGNCEEISSLASIYLSRRFKGKKVIEKISIKSQNGTGNHVFNLIDRNQAISLKAPEKMGAQAVVWDSWARLFYPASLVPFVLDNAKTYLENGIAVLEKFAPPTHFLEVSCENVMSNHQYTALKGSSFKVLDILKKFHEEENLIKKGDYASECLNVLSKLVSFNKIDSALYSQLYFYLHAKVPKELSATFLEPKVEFDENASKEEIFELSNH